MEKAKDEINTIDAYIKTFPADVQSILEKIRQTIRKEIAKADETISYKIPTFKLNGRNLVYFSAWKNHVAIYPIPSGDAAFRKKIAPHIAGKGTLRFPLDKPLPLPLIREIVKRHVKASEQRAATKSSKAKPTATRVKKRSMSGR